MHSRGDLSNNKPTKRQARSAYRAAPADERMGPRSVLRALDVLRVLSATPSGVSLSRLAARLELPKSSLLSLMRALLKGDYVAQERDLYVLGGGALGLAAVIGASQTYPTALMPLLRRLADQTNETVTLGEAAADGLLVHFIEVIESSQGLRLGRPRGSTAPIHAGANGQALLAFMPEAQLANLLAQPSLRALTKDTPNKPDLAQRIEEIRRTGVARSVGGQEPGAMGFGAPVFDASGALRCAIAAGGPISRVRGHEKELRRQVLETSKEMSRTLGYQGSFPPARKEGAGRT